MACLAPDIFDLPVMGSMSVLILSVVFTLWVWRQHQFPGKRAFMAAEITTVGPFDETVPARTARAG